MVLRRGRPRVGLARAAVATVEVLVLTALAHAWAGGALPSPLWFAAMSLVVLSISLLMLRGSLRVRTAAVMVAICQVGLHVTFEVGAGGSHAAHAAHVSDPGTPGVSMLLAHVSATVATALILYMQDRAASRVVAWLNRSAPVAGPVGLCRVRVFMHLTDQVPKRLRLLLLRSALRGPPAMAG